jgi:hypothetical protein
MALSNRRKKSKRNVSKRFRETIKLKKKFKRRPTRKVRKRKKGGSRGGQRGGSRGGQRGGDWFNPRTWFKKNTTSVSEAKGFMSAVEDKVDQVGKNITNSVSNIMPGNNIAQSGAVTIKKLQTSLNEINKQVNSVTDWLQKQDTDSKICPCCKQSIESVTVGRGVPEQQTDTSIKNPANSLGPEMPTQPSEIPEMPTTEMPI